MSRHLETFRMEPGAGQHLVPLEREGHSHAPWGASLYPLSQNETENDTLSPDVLV